MVEDECLHFFEFLLRSCFHADTDAGGSVALTDAGPCAGSEVDADAIHGFYREFLEKVLFHTCDDCHFSLVRAVRATLGGLVDLWESIEEAGERFSSALENAEDSESCDEGVVEGKVLFRAEEVPGLLTAEEGHLVSQSALYRGVSNGTHDWASAAHGNFALEHAAVTHSEDDTSAWMPGEVVRGKEEEDGIRRCNVSALIDDTEAVSVTIESEADVRMLMEHGVLKLAQCFVLAGVCGVIREAAIRFCVEFRYSASDSAKYLRVQGSRNAVPCINDDVEPIADVGESFEEEMFIFRFDGEFYKCSCCVCHGERRRTMAYLGILALLAKYLNVLSSEGLSIVRAELDAVIFCGVMARSNMNTSVQALRADGEVIHGAWGLSDGRDGAPTVEEPLDEGALEVVAGNPRVASDGNFGRQYPCPFTEDCPECGSNRMAERWGDLYSGSPADIVCAEDMRIEDMAHRRGKNCIPFLYFLQVE